MMIGRIRAERGSQELRIQGARSRTLLALMVLDRMMRTPLDAREFAVLAVEESDPTKAKRALPVAVFRLRDVIGRDVVVTDGETPHLDEEHVEIDLLTAHRSLEEAEKLSRERTTMRSVALLERALELLNGSVPFAGLYSEIFEASREELEARIGRVVRRICDALTHAGDVERVAGILARAVATIPGDADLEERLRSALRDTGNHLEADRRVRRERLELEE
jgi:DNA-binding SARP family transcriptional activator